MPQQAAKVRFQETMEQLVTWTSLNQVQWFQPRLLLIVPNNSTTKDQLVQVPHTEVVTTVSFIQPTTSISIVAQHQVAIFKQLLRGI